VLTWAGVLAKVLGFLKDNAKPILGIGCIAFCLLWSRGCVESNALSIELEACKAKPPVIQTVNVQSKARQEVRVVYRDGSPCPELVAVNDAESAVSVTQTASAPSVPVVRNSNGVSIGAGYLATPYAVVGLEMGRVLVQGQYGIGDVYGGAVSWKALSW
jgi:hypothetical protein